MEQWKKTHVCVYGMYICSLVSCDSVVGRQNIIRASRNDSQIFDILWFYPILRCIQWEFIHSFAVTMDSATSTFAHNGKVHINLNLYENVFRLLFRLKLKLLATDLFCVGRIRVNCINWLRIRYFRVQLQTLYLYVADGLLGGQTLTQRTNVFYSNIIFWKKEKKKTTLLCVVSRLPQLSLRVESS